MKDSAKYKHSGYTPKKQRIFRDVIEFHMKLVRGVTQRNTWANNDYLFFDLHAGPGIDPAGCWGSPLVFTKTAQRLNIAYTAHLFEADPIQSKKLIKNLSGDDHAFIHPYDHNDIVDKIKLKKSDSKRYGVIYADPSNTEIPTRLIFELCKIYPKLEVIINLACAGYKRTCKLDGYRHLDKRLLEIKPTWIVREPIAQHQWSIMIGSTWSRYPEWQKRGFHNINSPKGKIIWEKLTRTKDERNDNRSGD